MYIPCYHQIDIRIYVIFDEYVAFTKYINNNVDEDREEEHESPRIEETCRILIQDVEEEKIPEYHDMEDPQRPMEMPQETILQKRRPCWDRNVIQGLEKYGALDGIKISWIYSSYVSLMCNIFVTKPTCFEEAKNNKKWMDAMLKEY